MSSKLLRIEGNRYGNLVVIGRTGKKDKYGRSFWLCKCDCGKETIVVSCNLGKTKNCFECGKRVRAQKAITHGDTHTRLYREYRAMYGRCYNTHDPSYQDTVVVELKYATNGMEKKVIHGSKNGRYLMVMMML